MTQWKAKTQAEVAQFFGVGLDVVKTWKAKGMPGSSRAYDLSAIAIWLREEGPWRRKPQEDSPEEQARLRERQAKAERAWLELQRMQDKYLDRDVVHELFTRVGQLLRQSGEVLQRQFGAEAVAIQNEALEEARRQVGTIIDEQRAAVRGAR